MADSAPPLDTREQSLRLEKLQYEIDELRRTKGLGGRLKFWLPLITAMVPALALVFAVHQFTSNQTAQRQQLVRNAVADSIAAERAFMRPVLDRQMNTYMEAATAAATIASSRDATEKAKAIDTFWRLYWGALVMFESPEVSKAMKDIGSCLENGTVKCSDSALKDHALVLASALQTDYFSSWKLSPDKYADRSINYAKIRGGQ